MHPRAYALGYYILSALRAWSIQANIVWGVNHS
jgi:hypothetical protein